MTRKNDFGVVIEDLAFKNVAAIRLAGNYLNSGHIGLMLGAGVSRDLNLPKWDDLVIGLSEEILDDFTPKPKGTYYPTDELKELTERVKKKINDQATYFTKTKEHLYRKVDFDFSLAKKDLLIALSALFISKHRGTVQNVMTYNFDDILEWYFDIIGLQVNTISKDALVFRNSDINISHIHGFLPHDIKYGKDSDFLIFSKKEFLQRLLSGTDYWKEHFYEFFRRQIFITVGLSPGSLADDVFPYLAQMDEWYEIQKIYRRLPYGFAILPPGKETEDLKDDCIAQGVIPLIVEIKDVPQTIFEIVQHARAVRHADPIIS
jgi:hypothetical protein